MEAVSEFLNKLISKGVRLSAEAGQLNCYAPKGTITDDLKNGIIRYKAAIIALLEDQEKRRQGQNAQGSPGRPKEFPLSVGQKGLYILQKLYPGMSAYNVPLCFKIRGEIDAALMAKAWGYVLEQFPILTARVVERDGALYQRLDEYCKTSLRQRAVDFADDQQTLSFVRKRAKEPFDLNRGPLTRIELFTRDERNSILLITIHHIVFDGVSAVILLNNLRTFYRRLLKGEQVRLPQGPPGYQEFVAWEEAMLSSAEGASLAAYWKQQLSGELPVFDPPSESSHVAPPSFEGVTIVEDLPEDLSRWIHGFTRAHSLPPSVFFLTLFQLVLHKRSGQDEIIVGMPVMGRAAEKFAAAVGYFVNMIPLRIRCGERGKLKEFLRKAQGVMLDGLYHSSYPFPLMLEVLESRQARKDPVFQISYAYQDFIKQTPAGPLPLTQESLIESVPEIYQEGEVDLGLEIYENPTSFSVRLNYNPDAYTQSTARRLFENYYELLKAVSRDPDLLTHEYSIITEQERRRLLVDFNDTRAEYPKDKCIHHLFEEQVERTPEAVAVVFEGRGLTYRELNARANRLARSLVEHGAGPEVLVALLAERDIDFLIAVLAIFKAGGAYLPLDPYHPARRIGQALGQSGAALVITASRFGSLAAEAVAGLTTERRPAVFFLEELLKDLRREDNLGTPSLPNQLAYVIFTSGSTGIPKGAMVEHQGLLNHLFSKVRDLALNERDVVAQTASQCFDISVWQFLVALLVGGRTHIFDDEITHDPASLLDQVEIRKITILEIVPSMMRTMLTEADRRQVRPDLSALRRLIPTGEALPPDLCRHWFRLYPEIPLLNAYGPTECSDDVTHCPVGDVLSDDMARTPIGRPIANTQIYVLNSELQPQPIDVVGEIYVGGDGVGRGYINEAGKTAGTFAPSPFATEAGARLYRSGDLARYLPDGNLEYLGRIDHQVKIRGFRIELGEIEARLNQHPQVEDCAVVAHGEGAEKRLIAFYRAKESAADRLVRLPNEELRAHVLKTLPDYMAPAAFVSLVAIPLNPNGKVDRRALARMEAPKGAGPGYVGPRNETERRLVGIWAEVLGLEAETVGVNDDFFDLGGHSLLATQLISKIRSQMDIDLPLKALFEQSRLAQLAELIATAGKSEIPPILPVDRSQFDRLPLSFAQERLWFINQLEPDSAGYNIPVAVAVHDEFDIDQLEQAFNLIIARHENLRTVFPSHEGRAYQQILDRLDFELERIDLSHYTDENARDDEAKRLCRADAAAPFDLANGPLIRGKAIKLSGHERILTLNMHHIISDGWSVGVLINELRVIMEALREGRRPNLSPLPIQYVDYGVWQRRWLEEGGELRRQLAYWQEKLAGLPESLDLPADYPRPSVQSFAGASQEFALDVELSGRLKSLAEEQGCTLYMVLLAAFKVLLHRYTGQRDLCVGSPIANRQYGETEGLIGMFVNTLALRTQVEGDDTFVGLLTRVKEACLEAYERQDAPFEKVVDLLRPQRSLAISPLFQVMLILQNVDAGELDQRIRRYPLDIGISKFDLTVEFTEAPNGLAGSIRYRTALYERRTIERMVRHLIALCRAIITRPTAKVSELNYIDEAEKRRLLVDYNDTRAEYPNDKCIHNLFEEQAEKTPDAVAVVFEDTRLSYGELNRRANQLAHYLRGLGVTPDARVGICMERSLEMIVGLLGALKAGGAYVPLDPAYPADRLRYMMTDSAPVAVLTSGQSPGLFSGIEGPAVLDLCAAPAPWREQAESNPDGGGTGLSPQHLAYVIYTSGSTGLAKGVMVEHRQLVNYVAAVSERLELEEGWAYGLVSTFAADLGNTALFPSLLRKGTLHVLPSAESADEDRFGRYCRERRIDCMKITPTQFQALLGEGRDDGRIPWKCLVFGGESLSKELVAKARSLRPECRIYNHYGPTECTVGALSEQAPQDGGMAGRVAVALGRPLGNMRVYVLDGLGNLAPDGVVGEIYIGGTGVTRGYLDRPEQTAERFVSDPFAVDGDERMYKTGDLGRWLADGTIEFLGRGDFQVKIRGYRIELGEIEATLMEREEVREAVVIAREDTVGDRRLVAYYTGAEAHGGRGEGIGAEQLRQHLLARLPEYMTPAAYVRLEKMPFTPNGKVDRRALPKPDAQAYAGKEYRPPQGEIEQTLAAIWSQLLRVERVGREDDFFELGGHSLLATQLISKIRGQLGVDLPLKALFEQSSVAQLAELIATAKRNEIPPIRPADRSRFERLPLSFAQERLWFLNQLEPDSPGYNSPGAAMIRGELDIDQLELAFNLVIARHENLRTIFPSQEGQARQQILERVDFKLERIDLSHYTDEIAREEKAKEICRTEAATPFDLAIGPLIRGKVIKLAGHGRVLMLNMHHIISDGWSVGVLINELRVILEALRQGGRPKLAPLPIQYVDYSVWQREWLEDGGALKRQLAYWQEKLGGVPESLDLAPDYPRPAVQSFAGATRAFTLDRSLTERLKGLAEYRGCTLFMTLLAAFKTLLYRYTGQRDLCVGSPIANRQYGETEGLIGMFVNTLALRTLVDGEDSFLELLAKVRTNCLEAYENQDAPFEKVVDVLRLRRNLAISPLFQVMMVLQNVDNGTPDERIQRYPLDIGVSKFDLVLEFTETQEGLAGFIEYSTALYKPQTIARMIGHLEGLCRAIALTPGARVRDLDYLSEAEKLNLLVDFNANCADYPKDKCIHHLFVEQVALNPDKIAVVFGEQSLSYQGLYYRSHDLALFLQSQGVGPDSLVGLCMERSLEMVVCLFGILQAGGAYAPLDPDYPDERLAYMAQDSQAAIILTQEKLRDKLSAVIPAGTPLITVDRQWPEIGARVADLKARGAQLDDGVTSHHLAYVIYTSGSTGKPKGVLVEHQSLVNHATAAAEEYTITRDDRVLQFFTLSFDAAAEEIFTALTSGATLALRPDDLLDTIEFMLDRVAALGITVLDLPTAVWHSVVAALGQPDKRLPGSLRVLCIGGEAALPQRVSEWRERVGEGVLLLNTYGPTEATIVATVSNLTVAKPEEEFGWEVSIGKPLANDKVYVLDPAGRTAPVGVPGELYIGGRGVTRGYLGRPQLTAERFLPDPFGPPGARMYRSGDLARFRADGELEFRGRADNQVKVRGYRIELGEIESRLNQHPEIENSVVIARGQEANKQLIAFYQAADAQTERVVTLSYEELRAHLAQTLPEYMAPAAFVSLAAIPLNPNGKVDRRALARMDVTAASGREYLAPRNDTEKQLVLIWAHVLNLAPEKIGVNDNFFELGGHSLLAMQLIAKTNRRFNRMAPVAVLFTAPTIAAFAKLISNEEAPSFDILVPIQANGDAPPIFAVPGAGGNALSLRPLGNALGPKQPLFALQAVGLDGKRPPLGSVEQTAQANVAALKTAQPEGPYSLIGHSYGGVVAYEMARILLERGEGITSLILLDSIAPAVMQSNFTNDEVAELVEACMSVADIYGARPEVDVERLRQLSDEEKVHHLAGLLSGLGLEMEREHLAAFYRVYQSNLLCYGAYKPAPLSYEVDVSLYRATQGRPDRPNLPPDYGWGRLLQRPIRIYDVEADHFSILKKARVIQGGGV